MRPHVPLLALSVTFALLAPASAVPADGDLCDNITIVSAGDAAYLAIYELVGSKYLFWIEAYVESNGMPGLQVGGVAIMGDPEHPCQTVWPPDTLLF